LSSAGEKSFSVEKNFLKTQKQFPLISATQEPGETFSLRNRKFF